MGRENCTSLVHGVKDDMSLGFEWVVNCSSLCHVSHTAQYTNVVLSCMQHVQFSNVMNFLVCILGQGTRVHVYYI